MRCQNKALKEILLLPTPPALKKKLWHQFSSFYFIRKLQVWKQKFGAKTGWSKPVLILLCKEKYPHCVQSYKYFMLVNYDPRVVPDLKIPHITTLESWFTSVKCLLDWPLVVDSLPCSRTPSEFLGRGVVSKSKVEIDFDLEFVKPLKCLIKAIWFVSPEKKKTNN